MEWAPHHDQDADARIWQSGPSGRLPDLQGALSPGGPNGNISPTSHGLSPASRVRIASDGSSKGDELFSASSTASSYGDLEAGRGWPAAPPAAAGAPADEGLSPVGDGGSASDAAQGPISGVLNKRRKSTPRVTFAEPAPPEPPPEPSAPPKPRRPSTPGPSGRSHALAKGGVRFGGEGGEGGEAAEAPPPRQPRRPATPGPHSYAKAVTKNMVRFSEQAEPAPPPADEPAAAAEGEGEDEGGEEGGPEAPRVPRLRRPATPGPSAARERRRSLQHHQPAQPPPGPPPSARAGPDPALDGRARLSLPETLGPGPSIEELARRVEVLARAKVVRLQVSSDEDSEGADEGGGGPGEGGGRSLNVDLDEDGVERGSLGRRAQTPRPPPRPRPSEQPGQAPSSPEAAPAPAARPQGRRPQVRSSVELGGTPAGWPGSEAGPGPPSRPPSAAVGRRQAAARSATDVSGRSDDGGDTDSAGSDGAVAEGPSTAWAEHAASRRRSLPHVLPPLVAIQRPGPSDAHNPFREGISAPPAAEPPTARHRTLSLPRSRSMQPSSPPFDPWEEGEPWGSEGWRASTLSRPNTARGHTPPATARRPSNAALPSVVGPGDMPALVSRLNALMSAFEGPEDAPAPGLGSRRPSHEPSAAAPERPPEPPPRAPASRPGHGRHLSSSSAGGDRESPPPSSPPRTYLRPHNLVPSPSPGRRTPSPTPRPPPGGRPRFNSDDGSPSAQAGGDPDTPRAAPGSISRPPTAAAVRSDRLAPAAAAAAAAAAGAGGRRVTLPALADSERERLAELVAKLSDIQQAQTTPEAWGGEGSGGSPQRGQRRAEGAAGGALEVRDVSEGEDLAGFIYEDAGGGAASSDDEPAPPPAPPARPPSAGRGPPRPASPVAGRRPSAGSGDKVHDALRRISDLCGAGPPAGGLLGGLLAADAGDEAGLNERRRASASLLVERASGAGSPRPRPALFRSAPGLGDATPLGRLLLQVGVGPDGGVRRLPASRSFNEATRPRPALGPDLVQRSPSPSLLG